MRNSVASVQVGCVGVGGEWWEASSRPCLGCQQLALCQGEELGAEDLALGREGTQKCATWVSPIPTWPCPSSPPQGSTVPTGGHLSLPSANAILGYGTCQLLGDWAWGPTSCRDAEGLGSRSRAWENRPSKLPWLFPPAMEKRALQGHSTQLNIGTLGGGSGSCQLQGAIQFLLPEAGRRPSGARFMRQF